METEANTGVYYNNSPKVVLMKNFFIQLYNDIRVCDSIKASAFQIFFDKFHSFSCLLQNLNELITNHDPSISNNKQLSWEFLCGDYLNFSFHCSRVRKKNSGIIFILCLPSIHQSRRRKNKIKTFG